MILIDFDSDPFLGGDFASAHGRKSDQMSLFGCNRISFIFTKSKPDCSFHGSVLVMVLLLILVPLCLGSDFAITYGFMPICDLLSVPLTDCVPGVDPANSCPLMGNDSERGLRRPG
ncbi:hypothetical protein EVAR_5293_1 [Eumeta japonica]|uniref:Transmembrane protein n=1 Tax=Eumeta variegata TaxID=151549 RepID=A0A4C1TN30_EUMVA|nr:hypothetical protein EVAR_5293_1 [Eumeta japonica]